MSTGRTAVGRVALSVADVGATGRFYREVVGLEPVDDDGDRVTLGAGGTPLLELLASDASERGPDETGLFYVAFLFPDRGALGDALDRVESETRLTSASDHHVSEALYLTDPESNGVELYWDRLREVWPHDDAGHVRMDPLRLDLEPLYEAAHGDDRAPDATTVGHVHLEVSSLDAAEAFYVGTLELNLRQRLGAAARFLAVGDYHHHLGVNVWNGRSVPPAGWGLAWWELRVPDGVERVRERLTAAGHDTEPVEGGFEVEDPDGIHLRVVTD